MLPPMVLLLALSLPAQAPECLSLNSYLQTMREYPLSGIDLYKADDGSPAGRIIRMDFSASPPVLELDGASPAALGSLCVRRGDVEKTLVYRIVRIEHDYDGTACVSYDEGRPHSALFQRAPHNRGKEIQLHPYRRKEGSWSRISSRAGFFHDALRFDCGIRVGDAELASLLDDPSASEGHVILRQDSPLAEDPAFEKLSEFEWKGLRYAIGTGFVLGAEE